MNDLPCLCAGDYRCNQCRARDWHAKREPIRQRMAENALMAIARDWDTFSDDDWCRVIYRHLDDDLDRLLFQAGAS